jgi:hypothetical protein
MAETKEPQQQTPAQQEQWAGSPAREAWAKALLDRAYKGVAIEDSAMAEMKSLLYRAQEEVAKILQDYNGQSIPEWRLNRVNQQIAALERLSGEWDAKATEILRRHLGTLAQAAKGLPAEEQARVNDAISTAKAQLDASARGEVRGSQATAGSIRVPTATRGRGAAGMVYSDPRYVDIAIQYVPEQIKDSLGKLKAAVKQEIIRNSLALDTPEASMARLTSVATPIGAFPTAAVRAEAIVRTEFGRVSQIANMSAIAQMAENPYGIPNEASVMTDANGFMYKEWIAVGDSRTRPEHAALDGTIVRYDQPFMVGEFEAQFPKDPALPAKHGVNCRCMVVPAFPPEFAAQMGAFNQGVNGAVPGAGMGDYLDAALNGEPVQPAQPLPGGGFVDPTDVSVMAPEATPNPYGGVIPVGSDGHGIAADGTVISSGLAAQDFIGTQQQLLDNIQLAMSRINTLPGVQRTSRLGVSDIVFGRVTDILRQATASVGRVAKSLATPPSIAVNDDSQALLALLQPKKGGKRKKKVLVPVRGDEMFEEALPPVALVIKDAAAMAGKSADAAEYMLQTGFSKWKDYLEFIATEMRRRDEANAKGEAFVPKPKIVYDRKNQKGERVVLEFDLDAWAKLPAPAREFILRTVTSREVRDSGQDTSFANRGLIETLEQRAQKRLNLLIESARMNEHEATSQATQVAMLKVIERAVGKIVPDWHRLPVEELHKMLYGSDTPPDDSKQMLEHAFASGGRGGRSKPEYFILKRLQELRGDPRYAEILAKHDAESQLPEDVRKAVYDSPDDLLEGLAKAEAAVEAILAEPESDQQTVKTNWRLRLDSAVEILNGWEKILQYHLTMDTLPGSGYYEAVYLDLAARLERQGVDISKDFGKWYVDRELQNPESIVSKRFALMKQTLIVPKPGEKDYVERTPGELSVQVPRPNDTFINPLTGQPITERDMLEFLYMQYNDMDVVNKELNITAVMRQNLPYGIDLREMDAQATRSLLYQFAEEVGHITPEMILGTARTQLLQKLAREGKIVVGTHGFLQYNGVDLYTTRSERRLARTYTGEKLVSHVAFTQSRHNESLDASIPETPNTSGRHRIEGSIHSVVVAEASPQDIPVIIAASILYDGRKQTHLFGGEADFHQMDSVKATTTTAWNSLLKLSQRWSAAIKLADRAKDKFLDAMLTDGVMQDPLQYEDFLKATAKRAIDAGLADPNDPLIQQLLNTRRMQDIDLSHPLISRIIHGMTGNRSGESPILAAEALGFSLDPQLVADIHIISGVRSGVFGRAALFSEEPNGYGALRRVLTGRLGLEFGDDITDAADRISETKGFLFKAALTGGYTVKKQKERMGTASPDEGWILKRDGGWQDKEVSIAWHELEFLIAETAALEALARGANPDDGIYPTPLVLEVEPPADLWQRDENDQKLYASKIRDQQEQLVLDVVLTKYLDSDGKPTRAGELLLRTVSEEVKGGFEYEGGLSPRPAEAIRQIIMKYATRASMSAMTRYNNSEGKAINSLGGKAYYVRSADYEYFFTPIGYRGAISPEMTYRSSDESITQYHKPTPLSKILSNIKRFRAAHQMALVWAADSARLELKQGINELLQGDLADIKKRQDWRERMEKIVANMQALSRSKKRQQASGTTVTDEIVDEAFKQLDKELESALKTISDDKYTFIKDPAEIAAMDALRAKIQEQLATAPIASPKLIGSGVSGSSSVRLNGKKALVKNRKKMLSNGAIRERFGIPPDQDMRAEIAAQIIDELGGLFIGKAQATTRRIQKSDGITDDMGNDVSGESLVMDWLTEGWLSGEVNHHFGRLADAVNYDLMGVYETIIGNTDRHRGNFLVAPVIDPADPQMIDKDGNVVDASGAPTGEMWKRWKIVPIDNGLAFPDADVHMKAGFGTSAPWLNGETMTPRAREVLLKIWKNRVELHRRLSAVLPPAAVRGAFYRIIWMLKTGRVMEGDDFMEATYNPQSPNSDGVVAAALAEAKSVLDANVSTGEFVAPGQVEIGLEP